MPGTPSVAVFDIDGVLADVRHRLHHLTGARKDWEAFFAAAGDDEVLDCGLRAVHNAEIDAMSVVYLSGRPERLRRVTAAWLANGGFPQARLVLRSDRDRRPARLFKPEALAMMGGPEEIACVYDDDLQVVERLRELGYTVMHVTWAEAPPVDADALRQAQEDLGLT